MKLVSIYQNKYHSGTNFQGQRQPDNLELETILDSIKSGLYEERYPLKAIREQKLLYNIENDRVEELGLLTDKEKGTDEAYNKAYTVLKSLKDKIPRFTTSGVFKPEARTSENLLTHSDIIDIDLDHLTEEELINFKEILSNDKFVYSVFRTCGGDGLAVLFRINPKKHEESFEGIKEYLWKNYSIGCIDDTHKSVANTRNFSYDPTIYIRDFLPPVFDELIKKPKAKQTEQKVSYVYAKNDFELCVNQIVSQQLDFCPDFETYRAIGFAIASKFGLLGKEDFKSVCQFNSKYKPAEIDKNWKHFCRNKEGGKKYNISTFFHRCKELKIEIYSKETKLIASVASSARKTGKSKEDVIKNLFAHEGIDTAISEPIVNQVFEDKIDFISQDGILDEIQNFLKYNYSLKKNTITGRIESDGSPWSDEDMNSCYVDIKKVFEKADANWIKRILLSNFVIRYNPIQEFIKDNLDKCPTIKFINGKPVIPDIIQDLWCSLETRSTAYTCKFGTMWMAGAMSTWHGTPSNLELIFAGKLSKGKTYFIRHLLPAELQKYYGESRLKKGKDDEILACEKLIINRNECAGESVKDNKAHKEFLDTDFFSLRRPYGQSNEDMKRLCALFATTNSISDVLTDKEGNRRRIVTEVISRNFEAYDKIDKTELWMAVYALWKAGFEWQILGDDIIELNKFSSGFESHGTEYEAICKYFEPCEEEDAANLRYTAFDIREYIEKRSTAKLRPGEIIKELYRMKYDIHEPPGVIKRKEYWLKEKMQQSSLIMTNEEKKDLPF